MEKKLLVNNIIFEVTPRCNHQCMFCYNIWKSDKKYPKGELELDDIKKLLKKIVFETKCRQITLTGGEPFLREDLIEISDYIISLGVNVNIISNGSICEKTKIKKLIKIGVDLFEFPILGSRDVHNKMCNSDSFDRVTESIVNVKEKGGKVVTVFVATKLNIEHFEKMLDLSFGLNVDGIMFNRFNPGGEGIKNLKNLIPEVKELKKALGIADIKAKKYEIGISVSIPIPACVLDISKYKNISFGFCQAGEDNAYYTIDPLGNLRICNHSGQILGNLFDNNFFELVTPGIINNFVNALPEFCIKCKDKKICKGCCRASAEVCNNSIDSIDPFVTSCIKLLNE